MRMSQIETTLDSLLEGKAVKFELDGKEIAVFKSGEKVFAVDAKCPHRGGPLDDCEVEESLRITCPWHGWDFSLETGKSDDYPAQIRCYTVHVSGNTVIISSPE